MKYIRTKDGRIFDINKIFPTGYDCKTGKLIYENILSYDYIDLNKMFDIEKSADTIEELCDEFVAIGYGISKKPMVVNYNKFELVKSMSKECEIYGAIWTEWGLKYVTKMNDKGELELL